MNSNSNSTFTRGSIITMNNKEGGEDFIIVDVGTALGFMCVFFPRNLRGYFVLLLV